MLFFFILFYFDIIKKAQTIVFFFFYSAQSLVLFVYLFFFFVCRHSQLFFLDSKEKTKQQRWRTLKIALIGGNEFGVKATKNADLGDNHESLHKMCATLEENFLFCTVREETQINKKFTAELQHRKKEIARMLLDWTDSCCTSLEESSNRDHQVGDDEGEFNE